MRIVGIWKWSATSRASASSRGSLWHGMMTPTTLPGDASWQRRDTSAESMPPLSPNTNPRAPECASRWRSHSTIESVVTLMRRTISAGVLRERRRGGDDAQKSIDDAGVELPLALPVDLRDRFGDGPRRFVGALLGQRVEDIRDRDDAAGERDVGAAQAGVTLAVPAFVV